MKRCFEHSRMATYFRKLCLPDPLSRGIFLPSLSGLVFPAFFPLMIFEAETLDCLVLPVVTCNAGRYYLVLLLCYVYNFVLSMNLIHV